MDANTKEKVNEEQLHKEQLRKEQSIKDNLLNYYKLKINNLTEENKFLKKKLCNMPEGFLYNKFTEHLIKNRSEMDIIKFNIRLTKHL